MQSIFNDERRGCAPFSPNPFGTGRICPQAASRGACDALASRRATLLAGGRIRLRHVDDMKGNRS